MPKEDSRQNSKSENRLDPRLILLFLAIDLIFLRWVWIHFLNWGFWDWDYQNTLLEATRSAWVNHFQFPLWNPYIGGGITLAGNTLNHAWAPCFLPVLLLGTLYGTKLCILLYLLIGQCGMFILARHFKLSPSAAFLSSILYTLGGIFAQRLTHGHFEWIAVAWTPFVIYTIARNIDSLHVKSLLLGSVLLAFIFLDGGPYQFAFLLVFLAFYTTLHAIGRRTLNPLIALAVILLMGSGLASIKLIPVYETVTRYPREIQSDNFYYAPFKPSAVEIVHQGFVSRDQQHHKDKWMPYILNVGCYVGWIPILLALGAAVLRFRKHWALIVSAVVFLWMTLGSALPFSLWDMLHELPGFNMLRVPSRFNIFVLLALALLAGEGLQILSKKLKWSILPAVVIGLITADLLWVNGEVFKVAFCVPSVEVEESGEFKQYQNSPFRKHYEENTLYETYANWPSCAYPCALENRGVIGNYRTIPFESYAIPAESPYYRGEAWIKEEQGRIVDQEITPNRIRIKTNGMGRNLVINQNFQPGWRSEAKVFSMNGRLAVALSPGQTEVEITYRPATFLWGAAISLASLVITLYVIIRGTRHRKGVSDVRK